MSPASAPAPRRSRWAGVIGLLAALALAGPLAAPAGAAVLEVTDCGDTTPGGAPGQLRFLMSAADFGDTIVIPACRITLTGAPSEGLNQGGDLNVLKSVTLQGAGMGKTILDGNGIDRVLDFQSRGHVRDLTVTGGRLIGIGGGIRAGQFEVTLRRVEVTGNRVDGPLATGGGVHFSSTFDALLVVESRITDNQAPDGAGGGIATEGRLVVDRTTISGNTARSAGGILAAGATANDTFRLTQSTVSGNRATGLGADGGALVATGPSPKHILHTTIVGNASDLGTRGAIYTFSGPPVEIRASLLGANTPAGCGPADVHSGGFNLQSDTSCAFDAFTDQSGLDPRVTPLGDHGGPTPTHALLADSPALDLASEVGCPAVDQRGARRPQPASGASSPRCDIGAVERGRGDAGRLPGE